MRLDRQKPQSSCVEPEGTARVFDRKQSETLASSEAASVNDLYRERMRGMVFRDVAALHWHHFISDTKITLVREAASRWVEAAVAQVETELAVRLGAPVAKVAASTVKQRFDPLNQSGPGLLQRGRPYPPQNAQDVHAAARQAEVDRSVVGAKPQQQVTAIPE